MIMGTTSGVTTSARAARCALTTVVATLLLLPAPAAHMGQEWRQSVTERLDIPREAFDDIRRDPGRLLHYIRHDIPVVIDGMCDGESLATINASQAVSRRKREPTGREWILPKEEPPSLSDGGAGEVDLALGSGSDSLERDPGHLAAGVWMCSRLQAVYDHLVALGRGPRGAGTPGVGRLVT